MAFAVAHRAQSSRVVAGQRAVRPFNRAPALRVRAEANPAAKPAAPSTEEKKGEVLTVNDDNFEKVVLESDIPVLVDFWAPWCGPCRFIAPLIDELAVEYAGVLKVAKLDTDASPKTASALGIRSIPTVMIFKAGAKMESVIGAVPKTTLVQTIDKFMKS